MSKQITVEETVGIPDLSKPGLYYDPAGTVLYIVGSGMLYDTWVTANFAEQWHEAKAPGPLEQEVRDSLDPEIRGLTAQDIKEMLAMQHAIAAEQLVRR